MEITSDMQSVRDSSGMRSPIWYYGGKGNMTAKLLQLVPEGGRPYVEPYCGGASLFFAREPAPVEVLNDLNEEIVNLFRCFQDRHTFEELRHRIMYTLYARSEFIKALQVGPDADSVKRAWATFVKFNMCISGAPESPGTWGRTFTSTRGMSARNSSWIAKLTLLDAFRWRLMMAQIDCRDAIEVIKYWDNDEAVFYIDPPYVHDTRARKSVYSIEPGIDHHRNLVETILQCKGAVVLSGYAHEVYLPLEHAGWERIDIKTSCHAAGRGRGTGMQGAGAATAKAPRVETVWRNPKAVMLKPIPCDELSERDDNGWQESLFDL